MWVNLNRDHSTRSYAIHNPRVHHAFIQNSNFIMNLAIKSIMSIVYRQVFLITITLGGKAILKFSNRVSLLSLWKTRRITCP